MPKFAFCCIYSFVVSWQNGTHSNRHWKIIVHPLLLFVNRWGKSKSANKQRRETEARKREENSVRDRDKGTPNKKKRKWKTLVQDEGFIVQFSVWNRCHAFCVLSKNEVFVPFSVIYSHTLNVFTNPIAWYGVSSYT